MKNRKKKVPRKDRFKLQKKKKYAISTAPAFINRKYGISEVSATGAFKTNNQIYSKLYTVTLDEFCKQHEAFSVLREYNIAFRIYYVDESIYMMLKIKEEKLESACEVIDKIEADMITKLAELGIKLVSVGANERFDIAYRYIKAGLTNKNINVGNYFEDIIEWMSDFELKEYIESDENAELEAETEHYKMLYLTRLPNQIEEFLVDLSNLEALREIMFDFEAVKDQAVARFVEMNYMGYENELSKLKKSNPEVYTIYTGDSTDRDTRHYCTCGISLLLAKKKMVHLMTN